MFPAPTEIQPYGPTLSRHSALPIAEARLELGLNKAPALFAYRTDFTARGGRIDDRPVRTAFEHRLLKPRLELHGVRCREQNAAHRGTVAGKRAANRKSTRLNSSH